MTTRGVSATAAGRVTSAAARRVATTASSTRREVPAATARCAHTTATTSATVATVRTATITGSAVGTAIAGRRARSAITRRTAISAVTRSFGPLTEGGRVWPGAENFDATLHINGYSVEGIRSKSGVAEVRLSALFQQLPVAVLKARYVGAARPARNRKQFV